jgi:FAD/FMN-containing dehydrogenase
MTKPPSQQLLAELARLLGPRGMTTDVAEMAPWLEDWRRRYRGTAAAMLSPATTGEVQEVVRRCVAEQVALVPQGGNSSMVGGATPPADGSALLVSLRRMNRIRSLSAEGATCEAGVVLQTLHEAAAEAGLRFPLSLAAKGSATVGGLVSTNAGGTQVLRHGTMRALVLGLEAVLPDGSLFDGLAALAKDNRGYDLKQLLIGAEGTLGIVTAARLRLLPAVTDRAVAWVGLASPDAALHLLRSLERALPGAVESFELLAGSVLDLVTSHISGTRPPLASPFPWHVLVEAVESLPDRAGRAAEALAEALAGELEAGRIGDAAIAASEEQALAFWRIRESVAEAERHEGPAAKHDVSVEVAAMPRFIEEGAADVERRFAGTRVVAFGHLGDGNVHFNVIAPPGAAATWPVEDGGAVTRHVHDLVAAAGGSISAEHGIGQLRLAELERLAPERVRLLRTIKSALDPAGLFNPGKLVRLAQSGPSQ